MEPTPFSLHAQKLASCLVLSLALSACGGSGGGSDNGAGDQPTTPPAVVKDTTPEPFQFPALNNLKRGQTVSSAEITISGIDTVVPIRIENGEYSLDGGDFTSEPGTLNNGQKIQLRGQAPDQFATEKTIKVSVGEFSASLVISTEERDITPDDFAFTAKTDQSRNTLISSNAITVSGLNDAADISITNGSYAINGGEFTSTPAQVNNNDTVIVRLNSAQLFSQQVDATLTIGTVTESFSVTTLARDITPDDFVFAPLTGQPRNTELSSNSVTVTGINDAAPVTITNGEYSIGGAAFTADPGNINSGQSLVIRATSSSEFATIVSSTITVGDSSRNFSLTTLEQAEQDIVPEPFSFNSQTNVFPDRWQESQIITVAGINDSVPISIVNGEYSVNGKDYTADSGSVINGTQIKVRVRSSTSYLQPTAATLTIASVNADFSVTTAARDITPDSFDFSSKTDVRRNSWLESETVTIQGINDQLAVSGNGLEFSVNGANFTATPTNIVNQQSLKLRIRAPQNYGETASGTIQVGDISKTITVATHGGAPEITELTLQDIDTLKAGDNLVSQTQCNYCQNDKTQYSWTVEGVSAPVSNNDFYNLETEHATKKITLTVTPVNSLDESGDAISKSYVLNRINRAYGANYVFTAQNVKNEFTIWGSAVAGANIGKIKAELNKAKNPVVSISSTDRAIAVLRKDGSVLAWGYGSGSSPGSVTAALNDASNPVKTLHATGSAFIAQRADKSLVAWGYASQANLPDSLNNPQNPAIQIATGEHSVAALLQDNTVVTWGSSSYGGDSSAVQAELSLADNPVIRLFANDSAMAALRQDGSVVSWGNERDGGDSSSVSDELNDSDNPVVTIFNNDDSFVAQRQDKSLVAWGSAYDGGNIGSAESSLNDSSNPVVQVINTNRAYAAIRQDGTVVTWGGSSSGGRHNLKNDPSNPVIKIRGTFSAFAALRQDGSVSSWGDNITGANSSTVTDEINDPDNKVLDLFSNGYGFIALRQDGTTVVWGLESYGGEARSAETLLKDSATPLRLIAGSAEAFIALGDGIAVNWGHYDGAMKLSVQEQLTDRNNRVLSVVTNDEAFAALRSDNKVITWGNNYHGGSASGVSSELNDTNNPVTSLHANKGAFAAIRQDGSVVTWGAGYQGGDSKDVKDELSDASKPVTAITGNTGAFAALRQDGSVVTWGSDDRGGDSSAVSADLNGSTHKVIKITASYGAFAALRENGSVITWGDERYGTDQGDKAPLLNDSTNPVETIYANRYVFAAVRKDKSLVLWGVENQYRNYGLDTGSYTAALSDSTNPITAMATTTYAFAALMQDGSVLSWGDNAADFGDVEQQLSQASNPVKSVVANDFAFAALRDDGSVITWGNDFAGGDSSAVSDQLSDASNPVQSITTTDSAFAALRQDGTVVYWGDNDKGGYAQNTDILQPGGMLEVDDPQ